MGLMIQDANLIVYDPANRKIQGFPSSKDVNYNMFTNYDNALWKADRQLKQDSYPIAALQFTTNRKLFKLQAGDLFKFSYSGWGIVNMICRVIGISEKELGSEEIVVSAIEDIDYISNLIFYVETTKPVSKWDNPSDDVAVLTSVAVVEPPYILSGDTGPPTGDPYVRLLPLVARKTGQETYYHVYESVDGGSTYSLKTTISDFNPFGKLAVQYLLTPDIDKSEGIYVKFEIDHNKIDNINIPELFSTKNLAVIGESEFVTFQTMTLVSGTTYRLLGVCRGYGGTVKKEHSAGATFYFIGDKYRSFLTFLDDPTGGTRYYKFVPFSAKASVNPSLVDPISYTFTGISKAPYPPSNLRVNGSGNYATYITDNVLTWTPRIKGEGSGMGSPDSVSDATPTYEEYFSVYIYAHYAEGYYSDFSVDEDGWTVSGGAIVGDVDYGIYPRTLEFTCNSVNSEHYIISPNIFEAGLTYNIYAKYIIPSGQSNIDGIRFKQGNTWLTPVLNITDSDEEVEITFDSDGGEVKVYAMDGGSETFTDIGGDDVFYFRFLRMWYKTDRETQELIQTRVGIENTTYTLTEVFLLVYLPSGMSFHPDLTFSVTNYKVLEGESKYGRSYESEPTTIFVRAV